MDKCDSYHGHDTTKNTQIISVVSTLLYFVVLLNLPKSIFFTHELLLQLKLHVTLVFVILLILPWEDFFPLLIIEVQY